MVRRRRCEETVRRAAQASGGRRVSFVPTHYWREPGGRSPAGAAGLTQTLGSLAGGRGSQSGVASYCCG
jgi:hypothetical protein